MTAANSLKTTNLRPFAKGVSGNPSGRPKIPADIVAMARAASPAALQRAIELVDSPDGHLALKAIGVVLDRAYGRPAQAVQITGKDGGVLEISSNEGFAAFAEGLDAYALALCQRAVESK